MRGLVPEDKVDDIQGTRPKLASDFYMESMNVQAYLQIHRHHYKYIYEHTHKQPKMVTGKKKKGKSLFR